MKKVLLMTAISFILIGTALAEIELQRHTGEIGLESYYFRYKEPGVMQEEGMMNGIAGAYTFREKIMLRAEGRGGYGKVDYKNSGTLNNIDDWTLEFRGIAGYVFSSDDFAALEGSVVTPYIGIGYRYLNDDMTGTTSTGALGYERESNYLYSPIGIEIISELDPLYGWHIGLTLEYDYFWKGIQKTHLGDCGPGYEDVENDQDSGYGARAAVKLIKKGETIDFVIEPFIRYWNIRKSEEKNALYGGIIQPVYEPKNHTIETGIKFAVNF